MTDDTLTAGPERARRGDVRLCLTGDVMSGRGIDQVLRHPGDPTIHEPWVRSSCDYVELAEQRSGPIPRGAHPDYVWGHALDVLDERQPDAFVVNLETAVTDRGTPSRDKGIHYRMHPANSELLTAAGVDVAVLANNHVLDWSVPGLEQTLDVLHDVGIPTVGAGRNIHEAWQPAVTSTASGATVLVIAAGTPSSGIPPGWAAREDRSGVAFLRDLSDNTIARIATMITASAGPDDVVVMSLHWGRNWGYEILPQHRHFAHELIDRAGVHVVHGHSSHHPLGIEVHHGHPILYGCGDVVTDYEGIHGHERYRSELGALYMVDLDATRTVRQLELVPTKMERFRLNRPSSDDVRWLAATLAREGAPLGTTVTTRDNATIAVHW